MTDKQSEEQPKEDSRPQRYGWAPGKYLNTCIICNCSFIGDKRAVDCADCAYALPEPTDQFGDATNMVPATLSEERLRELRRLHEGRNVNSVAHKHFEIEALTAFPSLLHAAEQMARHETENGRAGFYMGKWYCFDNFSAFSVVYEDRVYPTAEHLYQALKFEERELREAVRNAQSARAAKKLARSMPERVRPRWDKHKTAVMITVCSLKMVQHEYVQKTLLKSGDREIVETSPVDDFWGCGRDGNGRNELGKIWMRLRDELRQTLPPAPEKQEGGAAV